MTLSETAVSVTVTPDAQGRALLDVACRQLCRDAGLEAGATERLCQSLAGALAAMATDVPDWSLTFDGGDGHLRIARQGQVVAEE